MKFFFKFDWMIRLKVLILLLFSLMPYQHLFSQSIYMTHGYSGNFTSMKGLRLVTDNYNSTRSWLDKEMGNFGYLDGYSVNLGFLFGGALWNDFEYGFRGQRKTAFGTTPSGSFGTRELRLRNNTFAWTFGVGGASNDIAAMFGIRLEIGNHNLKSRVYYDGEEKGDFIQIDTKLLTSKVGPSLQLMFSLGGGAFLSFGTYYVFGIFKTNMTTSDEIINNSDWNFETPDIFDNSNHTFGFRIAFGGISSN